MDARATAARVQEALKVVDRNLVVDSRAGRYLQALYEFAKVANPKARAAADAALREGGFANFSSLIKGSKMEQQTTAPPGWINASQLKIHIDKAAAVVGLDPSIMEGFVRLEAEKSADGKWFNPNSRNGSFKGLTQMGVAAWTDATKWLQSRKGVSLPSYDSSAFDAYYSVLAGSAYAALNAELLRKRKLPVTAYTLYAAHNQGVGGFAALVRGGSVVGQQSKAANSVIAQAVTEARGSSMA